MTKKIVVKKTLTKSLEKKHKLKKHKLNRKYKNKSDDVHKNIKKESTMVKKKMGSMKMIN